MQASKQMLKLAVALFSGSAMIGAASVAHADPLEGTWRVKRHGVNCVTGAPLNTPFNAIMQFGKGETASGYTVPPGGTPGNSSPELGFWKREPGPHNYSFKLLDYGWDDSGTFEGSSTITGKLELQNGDNSFSYTAVVSNYDANGNLLFSFCGAATGARFE